MAHEHNDHLRYTKDELKKNLILLEQHGKNYPCPECINKHLLGIEGLAEEGMLMTEDGTEQKTFLNMAEWARNQRRQMQLQETA